MKLSKKHTTIYVVLTTWHDGKIEITGRTTEAAAKKHKANWDAYDPNSFTQIHTIDQALPEVPKEGKG